MMVSVRLTPQILELEKKQANSQQEFSLPVTLKNKTLLSPGKWNGFNFTREEISKAFEKTDWTDKQNFSLIYDHDERAVNWLGWVKNTRLSPEGVLIGDLEVWDEDLAKKLELAGAKLGISARVLGVEDEKGRFVDFTFANFSVVYDPACKSAYINLSENKLHEKIKDLETRIAKLEENITTVDTVKGSSTEAKTNQKINTGSEEDENLTDLTAFEKIRKQKGMSKGEFYAAPRDPASESKLPIFDKEHVQNAMSRFNQTSFADQKEKKKAKRKIMKAARKYDIKIDKFKEVGPKLSNLTKLNGGKNLEMAENEKEKVLDKESETEEESKEKSEESEDLSSKLDLVLSELKKLSKRITKLEESEEKSEEVSKEPEEEVSTEESEEKESEESEGKKDLKEDEKKKKKKEVKHLSTSNAFRPPRGYTDRDAEFAQVLLSQAEIKR